MKEPVVSSLAVYKSQISCLLASRIHSVPSKSGISVLLADPGRVHLVHGSSVGHSTRAENSREKIF